MGSSTRLLIVDDHKMFLDGLVSIFQDEDCVDFIETASNGKEALLILAKNKIDIVVTDISMPEMDGLELTREIKKKYPDIRILVLSMLSDTDIISKLINSNVNGYLLKNAEKEELIKAISCLNRGENYYSEKVKKIHIDSQFSNTKSTNNYTELSNRECEVLKLITEEYTTKEIADKLTLSQHTVETHRRNMLSKLGVRNTAGLVKFALQNNIIPK